VINIYKNQSNIHGFGTKISGDYAGLGTNWISPLLEQVKNIKGCI